MASSESLISKRQDAGTIVQYPFPGSCNADTLQWLQLLVLEPAKPATWCGQSFLALSICERTYLPSVEAHHLASGSRNLCLEFFQACGQAPT